MASSDCQRSVAMFHILLAHIVAVDAHGSPRPVVVAGGDLQRVINMPLWPVCVAGVAW